MTVQERLARMTFFKITPDISSLKTNERLALLNCVRASEAITKIYLGQVSPFNASLYRYLQERSDQESIDLARYFSIHGCPWDAFDHYEPFVPGVGPKPQFGSFYPVEFTKDEWNKWLQAHPDDRVNFESNFTVIKRNKEALVAVPYSEAYGEYLQEAARYLKSAASFLPPGNLQKFLLLRADAFLSNDYFESDMAWMDTDGNPFEVTIGPYEVYFDGLLGLKASFESFIGLPDRETTASLQKFMPYVSEFDQILSEKFDFKPKGTSNPMEVVFDVTRGGEAAFGRLFIAYNLPNDRRVHDLKGSKKVFSKTMMEAKFNALALKIGERTLSPDDLNYCRFSNFFTFTLAHELAHGLGPSKVKDGDREVSFDVKMGDLHTCIEEAKADMLGLRLLNFFYECGAVDHKTLKGSVISEISTFVRGWRQGFTEAHSRANLIEYNWLAHHKAVSYDSVRKVFDINLERAIDAAILLSTELLNLQVAGDYNRAKSFVEHWTAIPSGIPTLIEELSDLPITAHPIFEFPQA